MKNFTKFTGKHLCRSLFSKKVTGYLQNSLTEKTIWEVYFIGFSLLGGGGNSSPPPIAKNLLIPLPTRKNPPPPSTKSLSPPLHQRFIPPLNINFLNGQNHSHHPIKNSPSKIYHPTALGGKDFSLTP